MFKLPEGISRDPFGSFCCEQDAVPGICENRQINMRNAKWNDVETPFPRVFSRHLLIGGLDHVLFFQIQVLGIIIPTDEHIFQRGRSTTNQFDTVDINSYRVNCWLSKPWDFGSSKSSNFDNGPVPTSTMAAVKRTGHPNRRTANEDLIVVVGSSLEIAEGHTRLTVRLTALELGQLVSLMPNSACLMLKSLVQLVKALVLLVQLVYRLFFAVQELPLWLVKSLKLNEIAD